MTQPEKSNTLYARLPSSVMTKVRAFAEREGLSLSAAAAELLRRGLGPQKGRSYDAGYAAGWATATSIIDILTHADEYADRIKAIGDNFSEILREAQGEQS